MIQDIINDIISALSDTPGLMIPPEPFAGDLKDIANHARRLPAVYVSYDGATFDRRETESLFAPHTMRFTMLLISKNHRSREDGAEASYAMIEDIRTRLIGRFVDDYGELWPDRESLISAVGPLLIYGLTYRIGVEYPSA